MINVQICSEAKHKMDKGAWNYLIGGSESELGLRRNRHAFQKWAFLPQVLQDVSKIDLSTSFLNIPLRLPVIAAPIGGLTQFHKRGDLEWASGLSLAQVVGVTSGVARVEFEKIIKETSSPLFYQHYFFGDDVWVKDQLQLAESCGYQAILVTVDTAYYGNRERDILGNYDPRYAGWRTAPQPPDRSRNTKLDWLELEKLRTYTELPLIIKGIVSPKDVKRAIEMQVDALWISNHGGRQLDNTTSTLDSLVRVASLCDESSMSLIFDGGIRRGSDVLLALLLGADIVAVGRLPIYGLILDGAQGIKKVFDNLVEELTSTMGLVGLTQINFAQDDTNSRIERLDTHILDTVWDKLEE